MLFAQPAPSEVSTGRYFQTGNAEFDQFFEALYRAQHQVEEAPAELNHARASLLQRLQLGPNAPAAEFAEALHQYAEHLVGDQVYVSLIVDAARARDDADPQPDLRVAGTPKSREDEHMLRLVLDAATELGHVHNVLNGLNASLPQLSQRRFLLQQKLQTLDTATIRPSKADIARNLSDSEAALPGLRQKTFNLLESSVEWIDALERSLDTLRRKPAESGTDTQPVAPALQPPKRPPATPNKPAATAKPKADAFTP